MIWLTQEKRFSWLWVSAVIYSTLFLVCFDLTWRFVSMSFFQLAAVSGVVWILGLGLIVWLSRLLSKE